MDGVGEDETSCLYEYIFNSNEIKITKKTISKFPHSIGLFYSAITSYLGFEVNDSEYKVMGLAAYGKPTYLQDFLSIVNYTKEAGLIVNEEYFDFSPSALFPFTALFIDKFGPDGISKLIKKLSDKAGIFQTGFIYDYAFVMLIGLSILLTYLILN